MCRCLSRFLHPGKVVNDHFTNTHRKHRINSLLIVEREVIKVNNGDHMYYYYNHPEFPDCLIYSTVHYVNVVVEGDPSNYFAENFLMAPMQTVALVVIGFDDELGVEQPTLTRELAENTALLRSEGYGVDDDSAPENIPIPVPASSSDKAEYKEWNA